jgi:hypothetical protein
MADASEVKGASPIECANGTAVVGYEKVIYSSLTY